MDMTCSNRCTNGRCCTPTCSSNNDACGDDSCGGTCGTCASSLSCITSSAGNYCDCFSFTPITYTFDGTGIDWSVMNAITINFKQYRGDGALDSQPYGVLIRMDMQTVMKPVNGGCGPDAQLQIDYNFQGGPSCTFNGRVTGMATIRLTMPTRNPDGSCTASMP
jgi:hypothetical protein